MPTLFAACAHLPHFTLCPALAPLQAPHLLGQLDYRVAASGPAWQTRQAADLQAAPRIDVPMKGHLGIRSAAQWLASPATEAAEATAAPMPPTSPGPHLPVPAWDQASLQLRCFSPSPVRAGRLGPWAYRESGTLLVATVHIPLPPSGDCAAAVRAAYDELFALLTASGKPHMVRIWNYVPRITQHNAQGAEIYREFNLGRSQAFDTSGYDTRHMPAATGIGCEGDHIAVAVLASSEAGINFENPRQISAYRYPAVHGPRPPSFARATAWPHGVPQWLFISGTAGIIGHQTVHIDDVLGQTHEAIHNVRLLLAARGAQLADVDLLTLYVRHARDVPAVAREVARALRPDAQLAVLQADICRSDLLVEMEALALLR